MTTILDPLGTPEINYNHSGKNIQTFVANAGGDFVDAVSIPYVSEETYVFLDGSGGVGTGAVSLWPNPELGDTVTIHYAQGSNCAVYDSAGNFLTFTGGNKAVTFIWKDPIFNTWRQIV